MNTQHNAHMPLPSTPEEALSAWWDDECMPHQTDRLMSVAASDARLSLRCYSLIGAALRQEHLDNRDVSALISARLAEDEGQAQQLAQDLASTSRGRVLPFPQSQVRRSMNRWRGAIAASFVAGLVGVGIWMMPQNTPENALMQQAQNVPANLQQPTATNSSAQALPVVARVTPGTVLPSWAQAPVRKAPMDPYLMTHFESVSPDLSEVMPSLRMTSFKTE
ncbi:sigma-E factor negative regulatory protein [Halothiobacillus sp.]|uniref:sigma-E factor negative regulatory protein n=1 Tax=Halothiobacillus sp. TaxID=1891311 RepID=UPI00260AF333|nr:sigma-E factor negative regulatory protein [Halothiobacillus sp.]MDD4966749.1 sigma-E factor negative regulatory protein [Halothiobacillus sp.]